MRLCCQLEALLARVENWQFDSFKLAAVSGNRPLSVLAFFLLKRSNLVKRVRRHGMCPAACHCQIAVVALRFGTCVLCSV